MFLLRRGIPDEWWLSLGGVASVVFGMLTLARPAAGPLALVLFTAAYPIVFGVLLIAFAVRPRGFGARRHAVGTA